MAQVSVTLIPKFNSVVVRQEGIHFFIASKDAFIIDKDGLLTLIDYLSGIGFINDEDLQEILERNKDGENKTNRSDIGIG